MSLEITAIIAVLGCIMTLISLLNVFKSSNKQDGVVQGQISNDLGYVKRGIDSISLEQKDQGREIMKLKETLIATQNAAEKSYEHAERAYRSATHAHKRLDMLINKEEEKV